MRAILKNKYYLYLTEFFAGMAVMAVELGASRLLAPYFSSSQIVWTIIIGTIMIAMALGNIYGGRSADRDPNPDRLYRRIIIAAVWIALIPVLGKYLILGISAVLIFSVNSSYLITQGKPLNTTLYYGVHLYNRAFTYYEMGYGSAMAWFMLLVIAIFTALIFRSSSAWVYYESEGK